MMVVAPNFSPISSAVMVEAVAYGGSSVKPRVPFQIIVEASVMRLASLAVASGPMSSFAPVAS